MKIKDSLVYAVVLAGAYMVATPLGALAINLTSGAPIGGTNTDLAVVLGKVATYLITIAAVIAVLFIIWSGLQYIFAGGESEKATKAKDGLVNGLIGLAIVLGSYLIINVVVATLKEVVK